MNGWVVVVGVVLLLLVFFFVFFSSPVSLQYRVVNFFFFFSLLLFLSRSFFSRADRHADGEPDDGRGGVALGQACDERPHQGRGEYFGRGARRDLAEHRHQPLVRRPLSGRGGG